MLISSFGTRISRRMSPRGLVLKGLFPQIPRWGNCCKLGRSNCVPHNTNEGTSPTLAQVNVVDWGVATALSAAVASKGFFPAM